MEPDIPDQRLSRDYWHNRPATTPEDREDAFRAYLAYNEPYVAAIEAAGDEPWHGNDIETRRELFMRRYIRPDPPAQTGLTTDLNIIRRKESDHEAETKRSRDPETHRRLSA